MTSSRAASIVRPDLLSGARLYGVDQSPWVAGVRLAFAANDQRLPLTSVPFGLRAFWRYGFVFPTLRLGGGDLHIDSFRMYALLESCGFDLGLAGWDEDQRVRVQSELERLFGTYALARCGHGRNLAFVDAWARMRDDPSTVRGVVVRALVVHYFHALILVGRWRARRRGHAPFDLARFEAAVCAWDVRLQASEWFTGEQAGFLDYAVFGHLQCMTSGLTDDVLPVLRRQQRLMAWAQRMIADHPQHEPMYVRRLFGDPPRHREVPWLERWLFWGAWAAWLCAVPVTALLVGTAIARRAGNPAHTGAVLRRAQARSPRR